MATVLAVDDSPSIRQMIKVVLGPAGHTVIVGEWGGFYTGKDRVWQDEFAKYLQRNKLSSFYWCLNPNSGDTGCARKPLVPRLGRALTSRVPACQGSAR